MLKPQDTLLALKYLVMQQERTVLPVRALAESVGVSAGEVSKSTRRLVSAELIIQRDNRYLAVQQALNEWLAYGVRYAYPTEYVGYGRGMATSWNCPHIRSEMLAPSPPTVWSVSGGETEGKAIKPIHESVPFAASKDKDLYRILALVDAVREGKPRERKIARELLSKYLLA